MTRSRSNARIKASSVQRVDIGQQAEADQEDQLDNPVLIYCIVQEASSVGLEQSILYRGMSDYLLSPLLKSHSEVFSGSSDLDEDVALEFAFRDPIGNYMQVVLIGSEVLQSFQSFCHEMSKHSTYHKTIWSSDTL